MAELTNFNPLEQAQSLADFSFDKPRVVASNKPSNINYAAHSAVLGNPDAVEDTYRNVAGEMEEGSSDTAKQISESVKARQVESTKQALIGYLANPSIDPKKKEQAALGFMNTAQKVNPLTNMLSEEALISPSGNETREAEYTRVNIAESIDSINEHKKQVQSIYNREIAKMDEGLGNKIMSFAELLIPFAEEGQLATIVNDWKKTGNDSPSVKKTLVLMGEAREDLKKSLEAMPPEQRIEAIEKFIDIVNNHKGIVLTDDNDFSHMINLQAVVNGDYSTFYRAVDDITSLLDVSIIGAPAGKYLRGLMKGPKVVKAAEEATKAGKVAAESNKAVDASKAVVKAADVTEPTFDATAKAISDYNDGMSLKQATHYAGIIQNHKGWKEARTYLEEFKKADMSPDAAKGFGEEVPAFFNVDVESKATRNMTRSEVSPVSVSQNYKDTNPEKARNVHDLVAADSTGEAAMAAYGTTKTEAIANDLLPEIGNSAGGVRNKVGSIDSNFIKSITPNERVMDFVDDSGMIYYFKEEKVAARSRVVNDFKNAVGLHARDEMFHIEELDDGIRIGAVYGPREGGFRNAESAMELTRFALRDYGVTEDQIKLIKRVGEDYLPVDAKTIGEGDFLVSVDHRYKFNPADIVEWSIADVKNNPLDWIVPITNGDWGSLQRHIVDAHSMLHPNITLGANVQVDKAVGLERSLANLGREFAEGYGKLPKERRAVVNKFIKDANEKGIDFNYNTMKAAGVTDDEMKMLNKWRESWDTMWHLENADLARTLKARGYKVFSDAASDTELIAKPLAKQSVGDSVKVYDPASDSLISMTKASIDKLYEEGGTIAKLRTPITVADDAAEHIISLEKAEGSYLRGINETDQVLSYRKGYYQVQYKDPKFVVKVIKDKSGRVIREQAVATAGTTREAELMAKRLKESGEGEYFVRGDVKKLASNSDDYWDMQTSIGRTSQKVRGKRLEDATSMITDPRHENILDPMEALVKSIRSTSQRVSLRDYLETTKARFLKQFEEVLPRDKFGRTVWPNNSKEIGRPGTNSKLAKDARTTYEYIRYIENGYINAIDDAYKAGMNTIADLLGRYDSAWASRGERLARGAAEAGPTGALRGVAFKMYLALNPLRQIVVQSHQAVRLAALFPNQVVSGKLVNDFVILATALRTDGKVPEHLLKASNMTEAELTKMLHDFKKSGLLNAVDANNLVREDLKTLADTNLAQKAAHIAGAPLRYSQRLGFDAGEQFNMMTAWLAHRNKAIEDGKKLTAETMDMVSANARNFTYNMNMAGDMPYNRNALSVVFQFMQVPHKALLQDFTNRAISPKDRAKLLAFDTVLWGGGTIASLPVINNVINEIKDEETRRLVTNGLEEFVMNKMITLATGEKTAIDFSDLAPSNMAGIWQTVSEIWTTDLGKIIASSPSGQLFVGNNPRITNFFKTAARYFKLIDDYSTPTEFSEVANEFAKISSGYSNAFKASYALKYAEKINSSGVELGVKANTAEAVAQLFGFRTIKEAQMMKVQQDVYEKSKEFEKDVNKHIDEMIKHFNYTNMNNKQLENSIKVMSEAWRVFGDNPRVHQIVLKRLEKDADRGEVSLYNSLEASMGLMPNNDWVGYVKNSRLPEEKQHVLLDAADFIENYKRKK